MANPSTAHEPSMEEILASIRQIISEDGEGSPAAAVGENGRGDAASTPPVPEAEPGPAPYETVVTRLEAEPMPEANPVTARPNFPEPPKTQAAPQPAPRYEPPTPQRAALPAQRPMQRPDPVREAEPALLSPEKQAAVSGAFGALAQTLIQNSRTLEDVVAESLQPMLKSWLDDNLPSLVERMVKEEIERVSRGRR
jgi:cell pole-organizing protein PopZ